MTTDVGKNDDPLTGIPSGRAFFSINDCNIILASGRNLGRPVLGYTKIFTSKQDHSSNLCFVIQKYFYYTTEVLQYFVLLRV